jgi:hypothetical protein
MEYSIGILGINRGAHRQGPPAAYSTRDPPVGQGSDKVHTELTERRHHY